MSSIVISSLGIVAVTFACCCDATTGIGNVRYDGKWKLEGWGNKPPGFKARITQGGLNFVKDIGVKKVEERIGQLKIPDIEGTADISITTINYRVSGMRILTINIPSTSLTPNSVVNGFDFQTKDISLTISGYWAFRTLALIPISDSGSFKAKGSSITLSLTLRIGVDSNGHPTVMSKPSYDCHFVINYLNVDLSGGGSWFYNMFKDQIVSSIKSSLNSQVCTNVVQMVNTDLEKKLRTLKMTIPIKNAIELDYTLVQSPTFPGTVDTSNKGEVYPIGGAGECPLPIPPIPQDRDCSRMVLLWVTDYLPNSAGYVLQKIGYLNYNVTPNNVPPQYKKYLNTSTTILKILIPQVNKMYPNMGMRVHLGSTRAPAVNITPSGISALFVGNISPYAILPNKSLAFLFTLNVTVMTTMDVGMNKNNITWKMSSLGTQLSVVRTAIGNIDAGKLTKLFNSLVKPMFIAKLNQIGQVGVPLPQVDGFTFAQPNITLGKGFLKVGTNLQYTAQ